MNRDASGRFRVRGLDARDADSRAWLRHPWRLAAGLLLGALLLAAAAHAAVPHEQAKPAYAEEQTMLQIEQGLPEPGWGDAASGRRHLDRHTIVPPGRIPEYEVIVQRGGNTWRLLRNGPWAATAGILISLVLLGLAVWHLTRGPQDPPELSRRDGRLVLRFTAWQRGIHFGVALSFVLLALTGLTVLFGKELMLPWMGHDVFSWVAIGAKFVHNLAGPIFVVLSLIMFANFLRHNRFQAHDWQWIGRLAFRRRGEPLPAHYFNAGEKLWFWFGLTLLGLLMGATGLVLDFPYLGAVGSVSGFSRFQLQIAQTLHLLGATLYIMGALGHAYLGTLSSPGAGQAMWHGTVSERWAREHHPLWMDDVRRGVAEPAQPDPRHDEVIVPPRPAAEGP